MIRIAFFAFVVFQDYFANKMQICGHLGQLKVQLEPDLGLLGPNLGQLGSNLGLNWPNLDIHWTSLGSSWPDLGPR